MPTWEQDTVHLSAFALKRPDETLNPADLANRLSNAIIETVVLKKSEGWEMTKMDFAAGNVTIHFKRQVKKSRKKDKSTDEAGGESSERMKKI